MTIESFHGSNRFLSNFAPAAIHWIGHQWPTTEHAYQASKAAPGVNLTPIVEATTPGKAKRAGRKLAMRLDWEEKKVGIMCELLRLKFTLPELREKLLATGEQELIEGNTWGDTFWGVCEGAGENMLGKLLMQVRREIREGHDLWEPL